MRLLRMSTRRWMVLVLAVAISLGGWRAWWTPVGFGRGYFCFMCRMGRGDRTFFGETRSVYYATEFSNWYSAHIEPQHAHLWEPEANIVIYNLFGRGIDGGSGAHRKIPIFSLSPYQHQRFLEHLTNIEALKTLIASIITKQTYDDDPLEDAKGFVVAQAMMEWEKAGYPGTWDDWWARCWKYWKEKGKYLEIDATSRQPACQRSSIIGADSRTRDDAEKWKEWSRNETFQILGGPKRSIGCRVLKRERLGSARWTRTYT